MRVDQTEMKYLTVGCSDPQLSSGSDMKSQPVMRGKRRKKNLIGTEFSPSEWNINNLNKYKK